MKKISLIFLLFFTTFFVGVYEVKAYSGSNFINGNYIQNMYIKKIKADGTGQYKQGRMIMKKDDNSFVYCLQPFVEIDNSKEYNITKSDYETILNMKKEQWERISLIAYYGYQYDNHSDPKWYYITQVLIWRTADPSSDIYFTDTLNGTRNDNLYSKEIEEIETLVRKHNEKPNFNKNEYNMLIGETMVLNDSNKILDKYEISFMNNVDAKIDESNLIITSTNVGKGSITLKKMDHIYNSPSIVYFSRESQNIMKVGSFEPIQITLNFSIVGGKISVNKIDYNTESSNSISKEATLANAIFGIYLEDGTKITEITTNEDGFAQTNYLPSLGTYYVKELKPSIGYELNEEVFWITLSENNLEPTITVKEKVIERKVTLFKVYSSNHTGELIGEPNISFDIFWKDTNEKFSTIVTDSSGYANIKLPYGNFVFKQNNSTVNYEKVEDFEIKIDEFQSENIYKLLSNNQITAKLKVVKIDSETKEIIQKKIKFKIFDVNEQQYVCQQITYPQVEMICDFETNENGIFITPTPLASGTYILEEIDQKIDGYLWNNQKIEFSIGENSQFVNDKELGRILEIKFENHAVNGTIEVHKLGETFITKDGKFTYTYNSIANVKIGLYDENNYFIKEVMTDENGYAIFENLSLGKYIVKEIATLDNYILDSTEYEVELKYQDQYTAMVSQKLELVNNYKKGILQFQKIDLTDNSAISNTEIEIYTENDELVFTGITDENGMIIIENLFVGKFYIIEKVPSIGYMSTNEKIHFEIKDNREIVKTEMKNKPIMGKLVFTKKDISTNEPLPNTEIEIYTENDKLVFSGITDENGMIVIDELRYGKYYILEKEAPSNYILNKEKMHFEIKDDGEIIKSVMTNEKIKIEVPNTLSNDYINIAMIILIGIGTICIVYGTIKKRKEK